MQSYSLKLFGIHREREDDLGSDPAVYGLRTVEGNLEPD